ncbi:hypothetical protein KIN20_012952 [Parelaphostrongylus tenuis]|uniref:Uncharacterized protein n=1 Tax=Parelaphostrongylus tenuis TaxID=148309 RepID=A0AAD5N1J9_PARTN|nr:hypothetical protein KIN20_012952 [Parelaphostrongylus tenuis]
MVFLTERSTNVAIKDNCMTSCVSFSGQKGHLQAVITTQSHQQEEGPGGRSQPYTPTKADIAEPPAEGEKEERPSGPSHFSIRQREISPNIVSVFQNNRDNQSTQLVLEFIKLT